MNIINKVLKRIKLKYRKTFLRRPYNVLLEMTNRCNLNCSYCMVGMQNELVKKYGSASHSLMKRAQGNMDDKTLDNAIKNFKEFGIKKVYLHFHGEPFLNPHVIQHAKKLKDNGFTVCVFTNGLAFNDSKIEKIAEIELDLIRFSIDGASKETYESNREGGNFDNVISNLKKVAYAHKGKTTRIEWQFLALKNNEHEIEKAEIMANEIGVNFFVKGFRVTDPELAPVNTKYHSKMFKKPCTDIYNQLCVYWNGDVVPCCYDIDEKNIMGNLNENSLKRIWNNKQYKEFRFKVDNFKRSPLSEPKLCSSCLRWE